MENMLAEILKAILVGLLAACPVGPVSIFAIQRTASKGRWRGYVAALGGTCGDAFYASVSIFGLSFISSFIESNAGLVFFVGGLVILLIGFVIFRTRTRKTVPGVGMSRLESAGDLGRSFVMTIANPGALVIMAAAISLVGLNLDFSGQMWRMPLTVLFVASGSAGWWFFVTGLISRLGSRFKMSYIDVISRVGGLIIMILGALAIIRGLVI